MHIEDFSEELKSIVENARRKKSDIIEKRVREMSELDQLESQFDAVARQIQDLIKPRADRVAALFENARPAFISKGGNYYIAYEFVHCSRFPATAKVAFCLTHRDRTEMVLDFQVSIIPVLMKYREGGRMSFPLVSPPFAAIADWCESRLKEFLEDYLRVETEELYHINNEVRDPVCSMIIRRYEADSFFEHDKQVYYFCSAGCREKFQSDPERFL